MSVRYNIIMDGRILSADELPEEERSRLESAVRAMVALGMGAVYGVEEPGEPEAEVDCGSRLAKCRAVCCTMHFALTKQEVAEGRIHHNTERPYFIARDPDGYCPHLIRDTLGCGVWDNRPQRCRRYDCATEAQRPY